MAFDEGWNPVGFVLSEGTFDPAEMALRGRLGAHVTHSRHDSRAITRKAREAFLRRFELEVDPDGKLEPEERRRRAAHAKKAYFMRLAMKRRKRPSAKQKKASPGS